MVCWQEYLCVGVCRRACDFMAPLCNLVPYYGHPYQKCLNQYGSNCPYVSKGNCYYSTLTWGGYFYFRYQLSLGG